MAWTQAPHIMACVHAACIQEAAVAWELKGAPGIHFSTFISGFIAMAALDVPQLQLEVLEALAVTPATQLAGCGPDGLTKLRSLYSQAAAADLVPQTASDDIARLHSLFEAALDCGMGGLILDYVAEVRRAADCRRRPRRRRFPLFTLAPLCSWVLPPLQVCSDRSLTSSDPLQAFLMDVDCVRRWVQKLLSVARGRLAAWLSRGLGFAGSAGAGRVLGASCWLVRMQLDGCCCSICLPGGSCCCAPR